MVKSYITFFFAFFLSFMYFEGCQDSSLISEPSNTTSSTLNTQLYLALAEGFESGSKTSYTAADVTLSSGTWNLSDALIGTSSSDVKNGTASARVRNSGVLLMQFNRTTGAGTVTIKHAKYGSDASSTWQLWYSTNSGSSWTQTGSTITTSSTTLSTASFTVNIAGTIRFKIVKTDATSARVNIDDIAISDYSTTPTYSGNVNLTMGNPSGAVTDSTNYANNYLIQRRQYCMSYNKSLGTANWVAWQLNSTWITGSAVDNDQFKPDPGLPTSWYHVKTADYTGSGFSRGHMCASADRKDLQTDMDSVYLMTNIMPQTQANNGGPWEALETYCRTLATAGNILYIYSGRYGSGGTGTNGSATTIASGKISVPAKFWKIIVVLPAGTNDLSRVTTSTRVIAVVMNNDSGSFNSWSTYRVTVDSIESLTGYDFLSNVSTSIQSVIEAAVDTVTIN
jgi:endonuclease G